MGAPRAKTGEQVIGVMMEEARASVDAGKGYHWVHVLDAPDSGLLSRKVENEEADT